MAALAMAPDAEEFPGLDKLALRLVPSIGEIANRATPVIVDHQPISGIAPGAMAIAMACWLMGFQVLWAAFRSWAVLTAVDARWALARTARSFKTAHFLSGACVGAFGGSLGVTIILAVWR